MTEQALRLDRAIEVVVATLVTGGEVPLLLLAVPGEGRLEQPAVVLDQVRDSPGARSQGVLHLRLHLRQDLSLLVAPNLPVELADAAPFNRELGGAGLERGRIVRPIAAGWCQGDRGQRPSHGMAAERLRNVAVATGAGRVTHVLDTGSRILPRCLRPRVFPRLVVRPPPLEHGTGLPQRPADAETHQHERARQREDSDPGSGSGWLVFIPMLHAQLALLSWAALPIQRSEARAHLSIRSYRLRQVLVGNFTALGRMALP